MNALVRAKYLSELLANATIAKESYSYSALAQSVGISRGEMARALLTPDEIHSLPRGKVIVAVSGMRPMILTMAHYGQVAPWRDWVDLNPLKPVRLYSKPLFRIHYPKRRP